MINLLIDGLIALVKAVDGLFPDKCATPTDPYSVVDVAQPAGAGGLPRASAASAGGHPVRTTSELLHSAALRLLYLGDDRNGLAPELRDRAAAFAAVGD